MRKPPSCTSGQREQGAEKYFCPLLNTARRSREEEICSVCDAFYQVTQECQILEDAFLFAEKAHRGQMRKGTDIPYLIHLVRTWDYVRQMTDSMEEQAAALLHDVLEDTPVTLKELKAAFGDYIADLVKSESEHKREERPAAETWKVRKMETLSRVHHLAQCEGAEPYLHITLGDKLANLYSMSYEYAWRGEEIWKKFNQKEKGMHAWYYGELGIIFQNYFFEGRAASLVQEYFRYYQSVFGQYSIKKCT